MLIIRFNIYLLKFKLQSVMIAGYDVHHAGPTGGSSVSAMCATMNPTLGKYFSTVRQTPSAREEVATCVAAMFERESFNTFV